jgi:hypothetical protein
MYGQSDFILVPLIILIFILFCTAVYMYFKGKKEAFSQEKINNIVSDVVSHKDLFNSKIPLRDMKNELPWLDTVLYHDINNIVASKKGGNVNQSELKNYLSQN